MRYIGVSSLFISGKHHQTWYFAVRIPEDSGEVATFAANQPDQKALVYDMEGTQPQGQQASSIHQLGLLSSSAFSPNISQGAYNRLFAMT